MDELKIWIKSGKSGCPSCRQLLGFRQLGRSERLELDATTTKGCVFDNCEKLGLGMDHGQFMKHLRHECLYVRAYCPQGCGELVKKSEATTHYYLCSDLRLL